jgi:hypothetical protein
MDLVSAMERQRYKGPMILLSCFHEMGFPDFGPAGVVDVIADPAKAGGTSGGWERPDPAQHFRSCQYWQGRAPAQYQPGHLYQTCPLQDGVQEYLGTRSAGYPQERHH